MDAIWTNIAQGGAAIAVLVMVVRYLSQKVKEKEDQIVALQKELRESEREYLIIASKLVGYMERGEKNFDDLKEFIRERFESLKS